MEANYFMVGMFYGGVGGAFIGAALMWLIPRLMDGYMHSFGKSPHKKIKGKVEDDTKE